MDYTTVYYDLSLGLNSPFRPEQLLRNNPLNKQ